jgi:hypothetical protein
MKRFVVCLPALLLMSQITGADYILTSGSNDTGANGGQSIIRYTDDFQVVWERSPAKGNAETQVFAVEINPANGDVYTSQISAPQLGKHLKYADGSYVGRAIPQGGQADGTGKYTAPGEAIQDIQFGYDYNKDGVADLWVCRRDTFEVYAGATLNRTGDNGTADLLTSLKIADTGGSTGVQDGTGGFGITFGPDVTGDGVGELYAMAGVNAATGTRLSVWNPVTMTKVATYLADGTRDNCPVVVGPDVNGDGKQDLWVADPRNHRIRAYNYATGAVVADSISLVKADAPGTAVTLRFPTDIDYGPEGALLITTRFATSLDPQWAGATDTAGGDLLQVKWDPVSKKGLVTLLFEYPRRLDSVAYVGREVKGAVEPRPASGTTDVPRNVILTWTPGKFADKHDVYFGDSSDAVSAASRATPLGVLVSQVQDANTYDPAGSLEFGKTYYWRVDEVNAPPDSTIVKGAVWSFSVEPFAYPVTKVAATASSSQAGMGPEKTIDGSGLNPSDQHSAQSTDMWLSNITGPQPTWIQYEFDTAYKLHEMWVWNSNQLIEASFGLGVKGVTIEYSTDGSNWTRLEGASEFAQAPGSATYTHNTTIRFGGAVAKFVRITANSNWGGLVKQYGLSEVRFFYVPVLAREPDPASGQTAVAVNAILSWRAGREAASHKVYLGTDKQAVANGTASVVTTNEMRYRSDSLEFGRTYFWKVTEVNEAQDPQVWESETWSFSTTEYAVVDDFESYTDNEGSRIYESWIDGWTNGTGSVVGHLQAPFAERTIVYSGRQSMPLEYNNVKTPFYSEAERTFDTAQDWTAHGADTLSLYFRGNPAAFLQRANGTIAMGGGGADIWGTADQFRFAYKQLNGNGSITVRVDSIVAADPWTKVGVMIRENLEAGSKHAAVVVTPGNGVSFLQRTGGNAASQQINQTGLTAPYWVKLTRTGNTFTAQRSADGVTWVSITSDPAASSVDLTLASNVYIGLAVTSHNTSTQTTGQFSNVATTGSVTGQWESLAIGAAQPSNDPAPLYVVVEDKAGHKKTVAHPDPEATVTATWQQWRVPLSDFASAGVNLTSIKKISVGVGDRANPAAGGAGMLYLDDIGFGRPAAAP